MKFITFLLMITLIAGCSTDKSPINPIKSNPELDYVPGEVGFGLKDNVSLMDLANFIYSLNNISIKQVVSFKYFSLIPKDSMQIIKTVLESKPYIWPNTVRISYIESESKILIDFWIKDFKRNDTEDWESLKKRFSLIHSPYYFQLGLLKVESGKEKEWINLLQKSDLFRFVELNFIERAN